MAPQPTEPSPLGEAFENIVQLEDDEVIHVLHREWWEDDWMAGEFDVF